MAERIHRWQVEARGRTDQGFTIQALIGSAYDAPPDHDKDKVRLRDRVGVVHSVVKGPDETWHYCHIEVMKDWLIQDGKNVVSDDTPITCVQCLAGEYEG